MRDDSYFSKSEEQEIDTLLANGYKIYRYGFGVPSNDKRSHYYQIKQEIISKGLQYRVVYGKQYFKAYNYVFLTKEG